MSPKVPARPSTAVPLSTVTSISLGLSAREAEKRAADLREHRRERREEGLPELTRGERLRERFAPAGGAGRSGAGSRLGEPRYLAAIFVVLALVVGRVAFAVLGGSDG